MKPLTFALLISFSISGNNLVLSQPGKLRFEHITVDQGLSDNNALCILQDSKGYIWFGTWNGLNRYDGYSITNYYNDPRDSTSLSFNVIFNLHEDREGIIWIVVVGAALSTFDRKTEKFSHFKPDSSGAPPIQTNNLRALNEDREGMVWIGNVNGELGRFDKATRKFYKWNDSRFAFTKSVTSVDPVPSIYNIFKDRSGVLWLATLNGLYQLNVSTAGPGKPGTASFTRICHDSTNENSLSSNRVRVIYEDSKGIFWIGTEMGLNRFDRKTNSFT